MNNNRFDYLIQAIKLMNQGESHISAFKRISEDYKVTYNTVSAQCTRHLGLSTDEFVNLVRNHKIIEFLKNKFPDYDSFN